MRFLRTCTNAFAFFLVATYAYAQASKTPSAQPEPATAAPAQAAAHPPEPAPAPAPKPAVFYSWTTDHSIVTFSSPTVDVILTAPASQCNAAGFDATLDTATVNVQAGLNVAGTASKHSNSCEMTVTLKAGANATQGSLRLTVLDGSKTPITIGTATVTVNSVAPGAVPPGLDPQVDATWQVEDYDVIKQNFGQNLANHYFGILIKLGNDTGYNLLLDGVAFETAAQTVPPCYASPNCAGMPNPVPSETPMLLQGVVAYGETYSTRNIALRSLQWASLLTTGFIPFFRAPRAAANFASAIAIFNGPFTTGFAAEFPDLTVQQLQRLGGSGVLGNSNELDNNSSATYLAFLSRSSICDASTSKNPELATACSSKAKSMNPALLTTYLSHLVLVGVKVPAANARFRVVASADTTTTTELTADKAVIAGVQSTVTISSPNNSSLDLSTTTAVKSAEADVTTSANTKSSFQASVTAHTSKQIAQQFTLKDATTVGVTISVAAPLITPTTATIIAGTPTAVKFSCPQCTPAGATTDWGEGITVVGPDGVTIDGKSQSTLTSLAAGSVSILASKADTYVLHFIPTGKGWALDDAGVAVQLKVTAK
jgi:hypothetical protein